jgi:hypothetical protein
MKDNYRKASSCFICKFHTEGDMTDWPVIFCNFDNTYVKLENIFIASDDEVLKQMKWEEKHPAGFMMICDDYERE